MKNVLSQSNLIQDLEEIILERYPGHEVVEKGIIRIEYHTEYRYHQEFVIKQKTPN